MGGISELSDKRISGLGRFCGGLRMVLKFRSSVEFGTHTPVLVDLKTVKGGGGNPKSPFTMGLTVSSFLISCWSHLSTSRSC